MGGLRKILTLVLMFGSLAVYSQNLMETDRKPDMILTQHWAIPTLLNPAATGDVDFIRIRGAGRLEWLGLHQSPKYFLGSADAPFKVLGKRIGTGIVVNSNSYFLYRNLSIGAQGSYKFQIKKSTLSVGIQLGYYHSKFKGSELRLSDLNGGNTSPDGGGLEGDEDGGAEGDGDTEPGISDNDTDLPTQDVSGGVFDIGLGVRYDHPYFHVAVSGLHLTNTTMRLSKDGESTNDARYIEQKLPATLYFEGGGNIAINNSLFTLQPSVLIGTDFSDFASVIEMRATYNRKVTFGVDYRWNQAVGVLAGLSLKNFYIGYAWEYDYRAAAKKSTGNHELVLGYQFKLDMGGKNMFRHRSIRIM